MYDERGHPIDEELASKASDVVWNVIAEAFRYSNANCSNIAPNISLKDFFVKKLDEARISQDDQKLVMRMAEMWGSFTGDPWERQSIKYFWLEECLDGGKLMLSHIWPGTGADAPNPDNLFVASTHKAIIDHVAASALRSASIHLSTRVTHIESLTSSQGNPKVQIQTTGTTYDFDEVILTVPLGCLKRNTPTFSPPLPEALTHAIQNTSYSRLEKVYLTFPRAFWDSPSATLSRFFPSFAHFLHPLYTAQNPSSWTLELNTLSNPQTFGPHAQPTLLFTIYGSCASYITNLITSLPTSSPTYHDLLNDFFKPYYSLLPNYRDDDPACAPSAILATDWQHDELAGWGVVCEFPGQRG